MTSSPEMPPASAVGPIASDRPAAGRSLDVVRLLLPIVVLAAGTAAEIRTHKEVVSAYLGA